MHVHFQVPTKITPGDTTLQRVVCLCFDLIDRATASRDDLCDRAKDPYQPTSRSSFPVCPRFLPHSVSSSFVATTRCYRAYWRRWTFLFCLYIWSLNCKLFIVFIMNVINGRLDLLSGYKEVGVRYPRPGLVDFAVGLVDFYPQLARQASESFGWIFLGGNTGKLENWTSLYPVISTSISLVCNAACCFFLSIRSLTWSLHSVNRNSLRNYQFHPSVSKNYIKWREPSVLHNL